MASWGELRFGGFSLLMVELTQHPQETALMLEALETEVESMQDYFRSLEDPRSTINRKHLLGDLIVICICAVIAGADGPKAIGIWALSHERWLLLHLELPHGIPSHDTIGRLLALLRPEAFQRCFQKWIEALTESAPQDLIKMTPSPQKGIAIDGKVLRRSHDRKNKLGALFLVSAWSVENGVSLGQLATEAKSNEITAIPELIDNIDVSGAIVTIDAAGCQKNIASQIIDAGGDFIFTLKGNQGNLFKEVQKWFLDQMANGFVDATIRMYQEVVTGHGRTDVLTYYHCKVPASIPGRSQWKGLRTIGVAIRESRQGEKVTREVRYFLCSIRVSVKRFARAVRGHWAIENTLHWCLDVTFREDESRLRHRLAANNLAWLKRFALSLLKQIDDKESIAMRRRMAGWNPEYLSQVLGLSMS
jgi:predicted transposase YbfD/YdcC